MWIPSLPCFVACVLFRRRLMDLSDSDSPANIFLQFYSDTRKHTSRMRTACFPSSEGGGVCTTPLEADPPRCRSPPRMLVMWPIVHAGKPTPLPVNRMTHRCKNTTLSQTSFAVGNESSIAISFCFARECHYDKKNVNKARWSVRRHGSQLCVSSA